MELFSKWDVLQVITKPFQGNQISAPHMIAQGKQVIQGSQATTFPGYATIPTIPTTQNQQTLVFSQLGVISSQPNILPNHSGQGNAQVAQQKPHEMQKVPKLAQCLIQNWICVMDLQYTNVFLSIYFFFGGNCLINHTLGLVRGF